MKSPSFWIAAALVFAALLYFVLHLGALGKARDGAYFEQHPEELRRVLNECRSGGGLRRECENAEAVATY